MQADIGLAAVTAVDREPVDEFGRRCSAERRQHRPPRRDDVLAAIFQRSRDRFDARAGRAVELRRGIAEPCQQALAQRSEEHTSELKSIMRNSYAVFCLKKKKK